MPNDRELGFVCKFVPVICYGKRNSLTGKGQGEFPKVLNYGRWESAVGGKRTFRKGLPVRCSRDLLPSNVIDIHGRIGNIERPAEQMLAVEPLIPRDRRRKPKDTARSFRNARAPEALVERVGDARGLEDVVHVE